MTFTHGFATFDQDVVGIVDDPVHDRFRDRAAFSQFRIDTGIPFLVVVLSTEDHRSLRAVYSGLNDLKKIVSFLRRQHTDEPLINYEQVDFLVAFDGFSERSGSLGDIEFVQKLRHTDILYGFEFAAGRIPKSTGKIGLAGTGSSLQYDVMVFINVLTGRKPLELPFIQFSVRKLFDVFNTGR